MGGGDLLEEVHPFILDPLLEQLEEGLRLFER